MALNKNGFTRKTYSDLLDEMEAKFKELFGADINLSAYTPLGIIMRVMAFFYAKIWDAIEHVYNSRYIKKANGVSLDFHGGDKNLPRAPATNSYALLTFKGTPNYIIESEERFSTEGDIQFALLDDVVLDASGNGTGEAISIETGAFNRVLSNTITVQVEPIEEITSVTNLLPAVGGTDKETDTPYRNRLLKSNEAKGKAVPSAIETAILNVPGVRSVNSAINSTNVFDVEGNPPKSVHVYVFGGTKEDIAQALLDAVAGGIETVGEQVVIVKDIAGTEHIIRFDYAEILPIYMKLTVTKNGDFEVDGIDQLKNSMIEKIGGVDLSGEEVPGLTMDEDVVISQLYSSAFKVAGVQDIVIEIGTSAEELSITNIGISRKQIAELSLANIEVIELA
ncbi:baseplate J/gp47 family protein [Viridibacillus sp. NPDC096237]|uniref:baseplate J/gp47 family protein n=1 Tax=Viridibacillus sp. NPDC096237 TaxID=3390721 RepID=UPI003D03FAE3